MSSDGFPWGTWAGALNLLSWFVVSGYLVWGCKPRYRLVGLAVMPLAVGLLVLAWAGGGTGVDTADRGGWVLAVHAGLMLAAFASFTVAAAMAALYLYEHRRLKRRDTAVLRLRLPSLEALDRLAVRVALAGLALLSAGIVVGITRLDVGDLDAAMTVTVVIWALYAATLVLRRELGPSRHAARVVAGLGVRPRRRRPPSDPLRVVKLALAGVSHHSAAVELRERVAIDLDAAGALARSLAGRRDARLRGSRALHVQPHRAVPRVRARRRARRARRRRAARARRERTRRRLRRSPTGSPTSRLRFTSSVSPRVSTRSCRVKGRSSARFATRSRPAPQGPLLDRTFRMALHAGRRARVETAIGESPSSVPAAAAALAEQVFEGLAGRRVVLVGAGRTSELTARNLRSRGRDRSPSSSTARPTARERLASTLGATARPLEDLLAGALRCGRRRVVDERAGLRPHERTSSCATLRARRGRPVLFVDLAVPRDVDPALSSVDGCFVYDIDDLEAVVAASLEGRRAEAVHAERIVAAEAERFRAWQASLAVVPAITSLRARAEEIRAAELARIEARLERLPESERAVVDTVTSQIVNKLLHLPTVRMKEAAVTADGLIYAEVVRHLFGLGEDDDA